MESANIISDLFRYNTGYLIKHLTSIDKSRLFIRPNQRHNPIIWIIGHIVVSRGSIVELLGDEPNIANYSKYFASGTKPLNDPSEYPHIDEVMGMMGKLGTKLVRHINQGGESLLGKQIWGTYDNIGKYIVNGYIHETYHVGQITYLLNLTAKMSTAQPTLRFAAKKKNSTGKVLLNSLKSVLTVR